MTKSTANTSNSNGIQYFIQIILVGQLITNKEKSNDKSWVNFKFEEDSKIQSQENRIKHQIVADKKPTHNLLEQKQLNEKQSSKEQKSQVQQEKTAKGSLQFEVIDENIVILGGWLQVSVNLGNLLNEQVDAITNAANEYLQHGAGVARAIADKGGPQIQIESDEWVLNNGKVDTGTARGFTSAGEMTNCKYVIHAVGPVWTDGYRDDESLLYNCVYDTLKTATKLCCKSVSLPAISSGLFRFPIKLCVRYFFSAVEDFCYQNNPENVSLRKIRFTNFDEPTVIEFQQEFLWRYSVRKECYPLTGKDNLGDKHKNEEALKLLENRNEEVSQFYQANPRQQKKSWEQACYMLDLFEKKYRRKLQNNQEGREQNSSNSYKYYNRQYQNRKKDNYTGQEKNYQKKHYEQQNIDGKKINEEKKNSQGYKQSQINSYFGNKQSADDNKYSHKQQQFRNEQKQYNQNFQPYSSKQNNFQIEQDNFSSNQMKNDQRKKSKNNEDMTMNDDYQGASNQGRQVYFKKQQ
ncbi:UNKNOWN [Stylonychia lemnae]|uniref:Macro domain-containing protein n=1 Tax=Stylonychia lemnae TaxID=5949 RepID=A0A078AP73_STYLE|nr:UNKNOWN [Stylonychia lemnae]|eukprot:CDW83924.1 UNKNOWN [Stylonychia lemnae]